MLAVEDLGFSYGRHPVLRGVGFAAPPGAIVSVLGPNGAGKSTLVKTIGWILQPSSGRVEIDGVEVGGLSRRERARLVGYVPQRSAGVAVSVREAVLLGRTPHFQVGPSRHDHEVTERVLGMLGLAGLADRQTTALSGGELQLVVIARALAQEPRLLLLDEPINHLDVKNRMEVLAVIRRVTRTLGMHTLIVIHDMNTALQFSDLFLLLRDGRRVAWGDGEVVTPASIEETFSIPASLHQVAGTRCVIVDPPP